MRTKIVWQDILVSKTVWAAARRGHLREFDRELNAVENCLIAVDVGFPRASAIHVNDVLEFSLAHGLSPTLCKLLDLGSKTVIMMDNCGQVDSTISYMSPEKAFPQVRRARQLLNRSSWRCTDFRVTKSGYFLDYSALIRDGLDDETDQLENDAFHLATLVQT
jgi:hypothetical protein